MLGNSRSDIEDYKRQLMTRPGVQAVGESIVDGEVCLKVFFGDQATADSTRIPENEFGILVIKSVSGNIRSQ